jgi:hypothetical protein
MNPTGRFINQFSLFPNYSRIWGQKTAVWIDTEEAFRHYVEIPELRAVIDKRASMMSSAIPVLFDANGERVDSHWVLDLVKNPNPTQSWEDVIYSLSVNDALWSSSFAFCPQRSFGIRNLIVPLPSDKMKINLSGRKLKQMEQGGLIDSFTFCYDDDVEKLDFDDVIYLSTTDGVNIVNPSSRIESLKYPLSNIKAQYHKRNVLLENIGAIGILSARNSDIGGAIPMSPEEKREMQQDWYKRQKDELIITEADVQWNPMSYPTKDLMLFEELTADKIAIIDAYGLNPYLFSQEKEMYHSMNQQLGLNEEGLKLVPDFSHIPVLQDDEQLKANAMNTKADAIKKIVESGVNLTAEEIKELTGINL